MYKLDVKKITMINTVFKRYWHLLSGRVSTCLANVWEDTSTADAGELAM